MPVEFSLQDDCSKCASLCCVSLAFDKSDLFAIDKANGQPCPHLTGKGRCLIHSNLTDEGFVGCVRYSCNGAGQRVTQEVFGGRSWQDETDLLVPMMASFKVMGEVHGLLILLREAKKLALPISYKDSLEQLEAKLTPEKTWTVDALEVLSLEAISADVHRFLQNLKPFVSN